MSTRAPHAARTQGARSRAGATPAVRRSGPKSPAERARTSDGSPLVLVVDDFADNRDMYVEYLSYCGFRAESAVNGVEAIEKAIALAPSLIVMDLSLPVMDGWEATRRLKKDARTCAIPVIALTGHALVGHSQRAKDAGCDAFLTKPCLPETLVDEVRRMLSATR